MRLNRGHSVVGSDRGHSVVESDRGHLVEELDREQSVAWIIRQCRLKYCRDSVSLGFRCRDSHYEW